MGLITGLGTCMPRWCRAPAIVLVPLMGAFDDSKALTADDPTADVLARRIQLVADALGVTV